MSQRDLVPRLRWPEGLNGPDDHPISAKLRVEAADEIEKLRRNLEHWRQECGKLHAKLAPRCEVQTSEPVVWRYKHSSHRDWSYSENKPEGSSIHLFTVEPLYAAAAQVAVTCGMTFGAPVENIAASDRNPIKFGIFIRKTSAKMAEYATKEGCHSTPLDNLRPASSVPSAQRHTLSDQYDAQAAADRGGK